ncbi:SRPBCC family protein [Halobacillus amylolyticus]|uniref:SRPBCC family protein n=1 Tax=Halobacillus amylolyticus TaxID=2932259 RepID=A0ABY4H9A4_9BACI|nr:SRPBCC family protein [Halobacillus amylolyticus]UOR11023.1 SRPBCC family protein [Halobacillus amylolyticus]
MAFLESSVIIQKPIDEVFAVATDFSKSPEIMKTVVDVESLTEGPVREGYQFKEVREIRGRKSASIIEVTDFEQNKSYSVRSAQHGIDLRYHYTFIETTEGTKVEFNGELETLGLRNTLMKPLIKKIIKKEDANHLGKMKTFIEEG